MLPRPRGTPLIDALRAAVGGSSAIEAAASNGTRGVSRKVSITLQDARGRESVEAVPCRDGPIPHAHENVARERPSACLVVCRRKNEKPDSYYVIWLCPRRSTRSCGDRN
jgi:hypothetical protein